MEQLKYVIEDRTIAQLLGVQNFTNDESAILELVKNAYDAKASYIELQFSEKDIIIKDNGIGMDASDIKQHWMHVGKSFKEYDVVDDNNHKRVLAGSKGIGRFALARLGNNIQLFAKKENCKGIIWETDWNNSTLITDETMNQRGIKIVINELREKWTKKKIQGLISFLSKTYNDNVMSITVSHPDIHCDVPKYFSNPVLGRNCLSTIDISYDSKKQIILTKIISDEFTKDAQVYCPNINLQKFISETNMVDELKNNENLELSISELKKHLKELGDFSAQFYFNIKQTKLDAEKFLYKYCGLTETMPVGVILYRNAFSISAYEGNKDWLGFGKRSRKSPAAASHPSGAWRVRENQIAGKVTIDKQRNSVLQDLSNRQGLDENIYYQLFIKIILSGITEFERYRQNIIRNIDKKNKKSINKPTPVSNKVVSEPKAIFSFTEKEARQLANEIKLYK